LPPDFDLSAERVGDHQIETLAIKHARELFRLVARYPLDMPPLPASEEPTPRTIPTSYFTIDLQPFTANSRSVVKTVGSM
jgi:hypothetical protein